MANLFIEILQDLYIINENDLPFKFPSPCKLKNKFIIKEAKSFRIFKKQYFEIINKDLISKRLNSNEAYKKKSKRLKISNTENPRSFNIKKLDDFENKNNEKNIIENINNENELSFASYLDSSISSDKTLICENNENNFFFYDEKIFSLYDENNNIFNDKNTEEINISIIK
jgi:hypothetical protein